MVSVRANGFDSLAAAFGVNLFHDAAHMIFDRVLGDVQLCRYLLVRQASCHQANQVLLPKRQVGSLGCWSAGPAFGGLMDVLEQMST